MADRALGRSEPRSYIEDNSSDEESDLVLGPIRSKRNSANHEVDTYFGNPSIDRISRPVSRAASSRSRGKRASYQRPTPPGSKRASYTEPQDYGNLDEVAESEPVGPQRTSGLEDVRGTGSGRPSTSQEARYSTAGPSRTSFGKRPSRDIEGRNSVAGPSRTSFSKRPSRDVEAQGLSEEAADDPVTHPAHRTPLSPPKAPQNQRLLSEREDRDEDDDSDDEAIGAPAPFVSRRAEDYLPQAKPPLAPVPRLLTELYSISYLIFFSILGTLARLGVQWLTFYPGAPIVTPVIWANFGGSLFMGFLSEDQRLFQEHVMSIAAAADEKRRDLENLPKAEHTKHKKTIPLYIGLAVGFCGSFTSFSSFARDAFLGLSNDLPTPVNHPYAGTAPSPTSTIARHDGYSFESWTAVVITTIALSFSGLILGGQLALLLTRITRPIPIRLARYFLDPLAVVLGLGCWIGAILLCIWPPDRPSPVSGGGDETWRGTVLFAIAFAPLGSLLRFYASLKLNGLVSSFPLGTFAVNMLGTAVEGMCYDLQHSSFQLTQGSIGGGRLGCQILQGVMDGFCGCLTTVSTWVAEVNGLRRRHGWGYAGASVMGALCLMVAIMGPVRWTRGFGDTACDTGYPDKLHG